MSARCAACGTKITLIRGQSRWCPVCQTLSCNKCRRSQSLNCPVCDTPVSGKDVSAAIFAIAFTMILLGGIIGGIGAPDMYSEYRLGTMPATPVGSVPVGAFVKLQGTLAANGTIAIDSRYDESHGHFRFVRHPVVLRDPQDGQCMTLELDEKTMIYPGPHPSGTGEEGQTSYHANDTVVALGTVFRNETGALWLRTERLGPAGMPILSDQSAWMLALALLLPLGAAGAGSVAWRYYGRKNENAISSSGAVFKITPVPAYEPPPGAPAIPNAQVAISLKYGLVLLAGFAAFTIPVVYYYTQNPGSWLYQMPAVMIVLVVILILLFISLMLLVTWRTAALEVVVDDAGVAARYRNGTVKGFRWTDIKDTARPMARPGKAPDSEDYLLVELSNGQVETLSSLTTQITQAVEAAQKKHAPATGDDESGLLLKALREKLETTDDPVKRARIEEAIGDLEHPGPDEGPPREPAAGAGAGTTAGPAARPAPLGDGLNLPPPRVFKISVAGQNPLLFRGILVAFVILLGSVIALLQGWTGMARTSVPDALAFLSAALGLVGALAIYLGMQQASHYFGVAESIRISPVGFSVNYRTGSAREFKWADLAGLISSTDLDPVENPAKKHSILVKTLDGRTARLDGLDRDAAEGLGLLFFKMRPNPSRIILRAKARGATQDELTRLLIDLVIDGQDAYQKIPAKWR